MKALVLAGGAGTRLWPLSRGDAPKQFLTLGSAGSFFRQTVERLLLVFPPNDVVVVTSENFRWQVLAEIAGTGVENVVCEPCARNTAPAIALGGRYCLDVLQAAPTEAVFVFPSDHLLTNTEGFLAALRQAAAPIAAGFLVVFGAEPQSPDTGYGYIEVGDDAGKGFFPVKRFVEKPTAERAQEYLQAGGFYWNAGMFAFSTDTLMTALAQHAPDISQRSGSYQEALASFASMPKISLDYALMEKANNVAMVPLDAGWSDIGSWDSLYASMEKDSEGNVCLGDVANCGSKNSLIVGAGTLVGTVGVDDLLLIASRDAVLVAKRGQSQGVREMVAGLAARKEVTEATTGVRPWGSYTVLETGEGYKVKRLQLNPRAKISLQRHQHRSEHWVVVGGRARIRINDSEIISQTNESAYIPKGALHRLENVGETVLQVIEVQSGDYLGEDDIMRFDDDYRP